MNSELLFTAALGLGSPWQVLDIQFNPKEGRINFSVGFSSGAKFSCPACGEVEQGVHDTRKRTWRHLNFFQYQAYIHADLPRVRCGKCGKTKQVPVPWARSVSGFSILMEALLVILAKQMPVRVVGQLFGLHDGQIWRVLDHYVQAKNIESVCIDMSKSYVAGVGEYLPEAEITFDPFHITAIVNKAVDQVRRQEAKTEPLLKKTRYLWLRNESNRSQKQQVHFDSLPKSRLKTARAWRIKISFQEIYQQCQTVTEAEGALNRWYSWAIRSRLEPMKEAARTVRRHWDGILSWFDGHLNNGGVEGANSMIQAAKARAKGYGTTQHLIAMAYLVAGNLAYLPAPPFITRCCG